MTRHLAHQRYSTQWIIAFFSPSSANLAENIDVMVLDATDAANPSSIADQNTMFVFISNARDKTARSLNRDAHSVKAELARIIYRVDGDDNDMETEER